MIHMFTERAAPFGGVDAERIGAQRMAAQEHPGQLPPATVVTARRGGAARSIPLALGGVREPAALGLMSGRSYGHN